MVHMVVTVATVAMVTVRLAWLVGTAMAVVMVAVMVELLGKKILTSSDRLR